MSIPLAIAIVGGSAALCALLIWLLRPYLQQYALARPNARSSHITPTPQGGGFAVVATVLIILALGAIIWPTSATTATTVLALVLTTLCVLGGIDDVHPLPVLPRFAIELACACALVGLASGSGPIVPGIPAAIETPILVVALLWFINLTNFMDGIDGITVAETIPVSAALAFIGASGWGAPELAPSLPLSLGIVGAMLGFMPFNRHVAKLFLGDSGSLAIGAALGTMLILLARSGHLAAAIILPLYYAADATITLGRRWSRGERLSQAHRSHFYQHAVQRGFRVPDVTRCILGLNIILAILAMATLIWPHPITAISAVLAAAVAVGWTLRHFERGKHTR